MEKLYKAYYMFYMDHLISLKYLRCSIPKAMEVQSSPRGIWGSLRLSDRVVRVTQEAELCSF